MLKYFRGARAYLLFRIEYVLIAIYNDAVVAGSCDYGYVFRFQLQNQIVNTLSFFFFAQLLQTVRDLRPEIVETIKDILK